MTLPSHQAALLRKKMRDKKRDSFWFRSGQSSLSERDWSQSPGWVELPVEERLRVLRQELGREGRD